MSFHRSAALCGALSLALFASGCAALKTWITDVNTAETEIAQDLPSACAALLSADAIFQSIVATQAAVNRPLSASVTKNESAAMAGVAALCANPKAVASTTAIVATVLSAYAAVTQSLAVARSAQ